MVRIHSISNAKTTFENHQISNVAHSQAENELFRPSLTRCSER
jgi:hypothetical protein